MSQSLGAVAPQLGQPPGPREQSVLAEKATARAHTAAAVPVPGHFPLPPWERRLLKFPARGPLQDVPGAGLPPRAFSRNVGFSLELTLAHSPSRFSSSLLLPTLPLPSRLFFCTLWTPKKARVTGA